jgi:hypothetical protein
LYGDVWVIIRPALSGAPLEFPCGRRYWVRFRVQNCTLPGACCAITAEGVSSGCELRTAADCQLDGGAFAGEGSTCAQICCPCQAGLPPVGSVGPNFADPNYVDSVSGGCNVTSSYPFDTLHLAASGASVCGTVAYDGAVRDLDWFKYTHAAQGHIRLWVEADFAPILYITRPPPGEPIATQCQMHVTVAADVGPVDCASFCITAHDQPPGEYWLISPRTPT